MNGFLEFVGGLIATVTAITFFVGVIMLWIAYKKKKPKKNLFILIGVSFLLMIIVGSVLPPVEEEQTSQKKIDKENSNQQAADQEQMEKALKEYEEEEAAKANKKVEAKEAEKKLPIDKKLVAKDNYIDRAEFTGPGFLEVFHATQNALPDVIATEDVHRIFKDFKEVFSDPEVTGVKATIVNEGRNAEGDDVVENMIIFVYSRESFEELDYDEFIEESDGAEWKIYNNSEEYYLYPRIFRNIDEDFMSKLTSGVSKVPPITE